MFEGRALLSVAVLSVGLFACNTGREKKGSGEAAPPPVAPPQSVASVAASSPFGGSSSTGSARTVDPSELVVVEHRVVEPARGKSDEENYWLQLQIWGEMKNASRHTVRSITADITYYDAAGKPLGLDTISSAANPGAATPHDRIDGAVRYVRPGESVPFHYTRNLAAIKGVAASHKLTLRPSIVVDDAPVGVAVGVSDSRGDASSPSRPDGKHAQSRRSFAGTIRNDGRSGCHDPKLVVSFLSPDGKVTEVRSFPAKKEKNHEVVVLPGASVPVEGSVVVLADAPWRASAPVRTFVDCR